MRVGVNSLPQTAHFIRVSHVPAALYAGQHAYRHAKKDSIYLHCPVLYLYETRRTKRCVCLFICIKALYKYVQGYPPPRMFMYRHTSALVHHSHMIRVHKLDRIHVFHLLSVWVIYFLYVSIAGTPVL